MSTTATPTTNPYWKSVKSCVAWANGRTEIHHHDDSIEIYGPFGSNLKKKTTSVTNQRKAVTPNQRKEIITIGNF